jgi:C1A family cysteine protease
MNSFIPRGLGWIPDLPDARDYTFRHDAVLPLLERLKHSRRANLPDQVDLRWDEEGEYFTAPGDQGPLNCSTAFAVLSLVEYFERRLWGRTFEGSKRFLYKVTRNVLAKSRPSTGDCGADLRTTLKVLTSVGVPAEEFWPFDIEGFDEEPSSFAYSFAKPLSSARYIRLDEPNCDGHANWLTVTSFLAAGFPVVFGFSVPTSLTQDADVPFRANFDSIRGGQAVVAVGYRNDHFGRGQHALLIRSSWGIQWGDHGNGWLPMAYLRQQLARDFWTLIGENWLDCVELSRPNVFASVAKAARKS